MEDEFVVEQGINRYGLNMVKVLRAGGPVELERRLQAILEQGADPERLVYMEWQEADLYIHYVQIWWKAIGEKRGYDGWIRE